MKLNTFTLKRVSKTMFGTFGVLLSDDGWIICVTAERPDLGNAHDVSCIPDGVYSCTRHVSPTKGECISINDVKGRTDILIHIGNKPLVDSEGCVLVGLGYGFLDNQPTVTDSRKALDKLLRIIDDEFTLVIEDVSK